MNTTATEIKNFLGGIAHPEQVKDKSELLPTKVSEGAPVNAEYLFEITNPEVRTSKNSGLKYVNAKATVIAPAEFEGRRVYIGLFFGSTDPEKNQDVLNRGIKSVNAIMGKADWHHTVPGTNMDEVVEYICDAIDGAKVIGRVGVEKGTGGYADKNKIYSYRPASEWQSDDSGEESDIF